MFEGIRTKLFNWLISTQYDAFKASWAAATGNTFDINNSLYISTVYTCIDILSRTVATQPAEVYQTDEKGSKIKDKSNSLYPLIHYNPNEYTTSNSFFNNCEAVRNFKGNSFAFIDRVNGKPVRIRRIPFHFVTGYGLMNNQLYYFIQENSEAEAIPINSSEILHFRMITEDGVWGVNPIEALRANLSATHKGLKSIDSFYENNANSSKAIKSTVAGANQVKMLEAIEKFKTEFGGAANSGKIIPLPPNTEIQELKLNFADAELINSLKYNTEQVAAVYGVPPYRVGVNTASKFNSVEFAGLGFKVDTMSSIFRMYRQELEFKLLTQDQRLNGKSIEFNTNAMIELDYKTKMEGYKILSNVAAISPNTIAKFENLPTDPDGDVRLAPMNMMPLEKFKIKDDEKGN